MRQHFKALYFPGGSGGGQSQKTLTLAFGEQDAQLFEKVRTLSSYELRTILGFGQYEDLLEAAEAEGLAINTFCLHALRERLRDVTVQTFNQPRLPGFPVGTVIAFDPVQATFRGGAAEPLHSWYPLLEGYSPKFVETIVQTFAPNARSIFDPFNGTGTTTITGMSIGLQAYYCEVNPLLQLLTETKIMAYRLGRDKKTVLAQEAKELAKQWPSMLASERPDATLQATYKAVFGKSVFFEPETLDMVLRARTVIDRLSIRNHTLSGLAMVAVLASLLPSSMMIRAGDIRYRNEKELARRTTFDIGTAKGLVSMADDLLKIESPRNGSPIFLCEDARNLDRLPPFSFDAVVTSPPYLNGTNYFRNTKIELWFLRCLQSQADLAAFRFKAVTGGINDVTMRKTEGEPHPVVREVVKKLEECAYDVRIPKMVSGYFADMNHIFSGLRQHLGASAAVIIDIGDSVYAGVHVPTQQLLCAMLEEQGYKLEHEINLRRRISRDRTELSQVLLVLKYTSASHIPIADKDKAQLPRERKWNDFKREMPFKEPPYSKRNWGHPLHSLCSYQGKMKPALAHFLVKTFVSQGGRILDPFAGVGTIPFEAALQGVKAFGFDISPAAIAIASGKVGTAEVGKCELIIASLNEYIAANQPTDEEYQSAKSITFNGSIPDYFHPKTLTEILLARRFFLQFPPIGASASLVFASLIHILHGNRPYALSRRSHPITPFKPTGPFEYRALIPRLSEKVRRSLETPKPAEFIEGEIFQQDATLWWPQEVTDLDAIITSPPFFDSIRFHIGNWMRLWFCGWERKDFNEKPLAFVDERQKLSLEIYEPIFRQARERLRLGGVFVIHLGQSVKCDMAVKLGEIAKRWFKVTDIFNEDVTDLEQHGIRDKGTVTAHQFLILS